jgi:hypothetical protein
MHLSDVGPAPTTPTDPNPHGIVPRGLGTTPSSSSSAGRFGRMFRHFPVYEHRARSLVELAGKIVLGLEDGKLDKPLDEPDEDENTAELDGEGRPALQAVRLLRLGGRLLARPSNA